MIVKYSLYFLFMCWLVIGSNLNKTDEKLVKDAWKTKNITLPKEILVTTAKKYFIDTEPVRSRTNITPIFESDIDGMTLNDFVDIWNPYKVARYWTPDEYVTLNLSINCEKDITNYMLGASAGTQWALKMIDASGKYTWGLLSGNMFWVGAVDQCREMEKEFIEWRRTGNVERKKDLPPFLVSVNSATIVLNILQTELNGTYNIMMGLCLPISCDRQDVEKLLQFVPNKTDDLSREIKIENIRNLSKGYSFWGDPIFYVILITFCVVLVFVVLGTFYDIALRYEVLSNEKMSRNIDIPMTEMKIFAPNGNVCKEIPITSWTKLWSVKQHNASIDVQNSTSKPKPWSEALLSFSLLLNLSKVFSFDVGTDTLAPIHGLRFLSMLWVILVHTCLTTNVISEDRTFRSTAENNFLYQTISNGTYAVDTFFFISGCLVSFLYFRTITKNLMKEKKVITNGWTGKTFQFLGMMFYRYFRLTPPYLLVIGLIQVSMSWYYDYTMLELYTIDYQNCRKYWWRNILYVNTYFHMDERCLVWSWYLANDTQFYTIGIIILIIGASCIPLAAFMTFFFLITSWLITAIITLNTKHVPSIQEPFAHYDSLYDKPWSRIGPYLIGMIAGWYLYKKECKLKMHRAFVLVGWILSVITMLSIVYGLYGSMFGPVLSATYTALSHSGWAICVAWILIACVTGNGGVANQILSWKYLYPVSRLSYCTYLIHPAIMRAVVLDGEGSIHLTQGLMAILFLGFTVASYAASLFLSLLFEAPVVSLLRIVHPMRSWKDSK